jgi:pimeloyl-ACP methyl ester carboxylesterase
MPFGQIETFTHNDVRLAFERQTGAAPTFVWLGGFKSDMAGAKAQRLAEWAHARNQAFVRFDYSGHGRSGGRFQDQTVSDWLDDTLAVLDAHSQGPLVLVGSSMGGWIALLAARRRPQRIKGLLLIAPAADFTEALLWTSLAPEARRQIMETGLLQQPSAYDAEPYVITRALIEDGRRHLIMGGPIVFDGPVRILQGARDPDVPHQHARALAGLIRAPDVRFDLIADGDHRLSRPQDLERLSAAATELAERLAP